MKFNSECIRKWKEAAIPHLKVLSQHSSGKTEQKQLYVIRWKYKRFIPEQLNFKKYNSNRKVKIINETSVAIFVRLCFFFFGRVGVKTVASQYMASSCHFGSKSLVSITYSFDASPI
jgi:hypothetical protein